MQELLVTPIQYLKGVGPKKAELFFGIGIRSVEDLLYFFPRRYEDRSNILTVAQLKEGQSQTVRVKILSKSVRQSWRKRRFSILEVLAGDDTGQIVCVWFNQGYLGQYFLPGRSLILYGKVERYSGRMQMSSPEFEFIDQDDPDPGSSKQYESLNIGRIVGVYSLPQGLSQRLIRSLIKKILDEYLPKIADFLPYFVRSRNNLFNLAKALINIHLPENMGAQRLAYTRLSFEEFFLFQIPLVLRKMKNKDIPGISHQVEGRLLDDFLRSIPFELTRAQKESLNEIKSDMAGSFAMQRLLQGDVGSGKTIIATIAGVIALQGNYQVAFMAPTEILAQQHYEKLSSQLSVLSCQQRKKIRVGLLTSSVLKKQKDAMIREIKEGKVDLVIGTHALLEEGVQFKNLGLVVIDEQHKFGVGQRALLPQKGPSPDVLIMTATPIPRTLAITIYGDLDISIINELPPGRAKTKTLIFDQDGRVSAYKIIRDNLKKGFQGYIVYPVIDESEALDISGAKKMYEKLKSTVFKDFRVGLIHGKLKDEQQQEIMLKFKNKEIDLLVSTTVLEVGIDIPNAVCMAIEHADRYGLSQLHQLRGRVGRGPQQSFCLLISDSPSDDARLRLEAMVKYTDGFRIAEEDLKIRGPGQFFGTRQHGLTELRVANPLTQMQLLKKAREEAINILNKDKYLQDRQNLLLKQRLLQRFPGYEKLMVVG